MNEKVNRMFEDFSNKNGAVKPEVVESCSLVADILELGDDSNELKMTLNRAQNDVLFAIELPEPMTVIARLFSEATVNAKCYDLYNTGSGAKVIITYENAIK